MSGEKKEKNVSQSIGEIDWEIGEIKFLFHFFPNEPIRF